MESNTGTELTVEYLKLEKRKFWVRVVFLSLILLALIYVGIKAGGDPCERCKLRIDSSDQTLSYRELIKEYTKPILETRQIVNYSQQNVSEFIVRN